MTYTVHVSSTMWRIRINHLTPLLVVMMPYVFWFLWPADRIEDFKRCLHFRNGVAFWRALLRDVYFEGPNRAWRALKTSILNNGLVNLEALGFNRLCLKVLGCFFLWNIQNTCIVQLGRAGIILVQTWPFRLVADSFQMTWTQLIRGL